MFLAVLNVGELILSDVSEGTTETEILTGKLPCPQCKLTFKIERGIPPFVEPGNYATSDFSRAASAWNSLIVTMAQTCPANACIAKQHGNQRGCAASGCSRWAPEPGNVARASRLFYIRKRFREEASNSKIIK
jgi:uncharacterized protein YbaR (Trm112 family)